MSRVDEAMRRAAQPAAAPAPSRREHTPPERTSSAATATLDTFGVEAPTVPQVAQDFTPAPGSSERHPAPARAPSTPAAPAVARAPHAEADARLLDVSPAVRNPRLIVNPQMSPISGMQYRRLAASLHDLQMENGLKVVMVSSAVPQEGKTLTIANLALTLSESYHRRTLLVDADLRRPGVHELFGVSKAPGLADVLGGAGTQLPVVRVSQWLSVLTAGQSAVTPLAQLTSDRLRVVIADVAAHFDWVLLDTPPVSLLPDAQHVASVSQGVLLVIAAGVTPYALVQRAITAIGAERILGTTLNYVEDRLLRERELYGRYYASPAT